MTVSASSNHHIEVSGMAQGWAIVSMSRSTAACEASFNFGLDKRRCCITLLAICAEKSFRPTSRHPQAYSR